MADLLFETGTEELPPVLINALTNQILENIKNEFNKNNISFTKQQTFNTPRRIAILISDLPLKQESRTVEIKGPNKNKAFDKNNNPTTALVGFAKKYNLEPKDLVIKTINNTEFVFAITKSSSLETKDILSKILVESLRQVTGDKFMRWGSHDEKFARPIRWILAILDNEIIKFSYSGIESSNYTYGHKFLTNNENKPIKIEVDSPKKYEDILLENYVIVNPLLRKQKLIDTINNLISKEGNIDVIDQDLQLLNEVTNVTEYPSAILCSFEKEFLSLPKCIIKTVLEKQQKCFILKEHGNLLPHFIAITNGIELLHKENEKDIRDEIKKGNEKVVKARLRDAQFFFNEDLKTAFTYKARNKQLSKITFQKGLKSMNEKVQRLIKLSEYLYEKLKKTNNLNLSREDLTTTAQLCKLDLTTHVVFELVELQGEIGSIYAQINNYSETIYKGIFEHYLPKYVGDKLPETLTGLIIGILDKLDNIICLFANGKIPSGSADPFALRRQAQGIVDCILHSKQSREKFIINLSDLIDFFKKNIADDELKIKLTNETEKQIKDFLLDRFKAAMLAVCEEIDLIQAVCSIGNPLSDLNTSREKILTIKEFFHSQKGKIVPFITAAKRLVRIVEADANGNLDVKNLQSEYEKLLFAKIEELNKKQYPSYKEFLTDLSTLTEPINVFFDKVLVNDPNPKIKQTRQTLLKKGKELFEKLCDFNQIQDRK